MIAVRVISLAVFSIVHYAQTKFDNLSNCIASMVPFVQDFGIFHLRSLLYGPGNQFLRVL